MRVRVIASLVMALCLTAGTASAQSIGVYFDAAGLTCAGTIPPYAPGTFYILARLGGGVAAGVTGAEFRLDGVNPAWFTTAIPAGNAVIGSPHSGVPQGVNEGFDSCQPGVGGMVLLYTYNVVFFTPVPETYLIIRQHTVPPNPAFQCPSLFMCDPPNFTQVCAVGGAGILNGRPCTVGVEAKSWSGVKALYN